MRNLIHCFFILAFTTSYSFAQTDSIRVKTLNNSKKFGIGLTFSTIFTNNYSPLGFEPEKKSAFYDIYRYNWPFPIPPGIEVLYQPSHTITFLVGLKYKFIHDYSPKESSSGLYNYRNFTSSFQTNYSPFKIKQYPFIGLKLLYEYKYFSYVWKFSDDVRKSSTSSLISFQIPLGYSFNIKERITINLETTFNLLSYSTVNYSSTNLITNPPSTNPIAITNKESLVRFHSPIDLIKENHFLGALWLKFYYRINIYKK
jgi:hypothetical protein